MKYILVILMTMGVVGEEPKTIEMRIPQENRKECLKSAKTFKFTLPIPDGHPLDGDTLRTPFGE